MFLLTLSFLLQATEMAPNGVPAATAVAGEADGNTALSAISDAMRSGRLEEASTLIETYAGKHGGAHDDALTLLRAELAIERDALRDAGEIIAMVKATDALRCRVERVRGLVAQTGNRKDDAIDLLGDVAENCSADWRVWTALGTLLAERGEAEASRFAFANAMSEAGDRPEVRRQYARMLIKLGDPLAAAQALQPHVRSSPGDGQARRLLDFANGMRGLEPERSAHELDQSWALRLAAAAQGARQGGRADFARALFAQALLVSPRYDERLLAEASAP